MGVCYSTHNSADCCCDDPCCGPICDCCCDRTRIYPWGPRVLPPPVFYPAPIGPAPGPIIVQPAPIPAPLLPYPSQVSQTFLQPLQLASYPPQPQLQQYTSPPQTPRYH
ncbi:hypothetical protein I302_108202 [Kwoniella bestiolae CBS 10118]|uniref:Uncharacterized protein n=1 Tax=Kwoniella bestiolae CBS 10118 TaxID=1296100 RepID=A0AAJ8KDY1_9TREE